MRMDVQGQLQASIDALNATEDLSPAQALLELALRKWLEVLDEISGQEEFNDLLQEYSSARLTAVLDEVAKARSEGELARSVKDLVGEMVVFVTYLTESVSFTTILSAQRWRSQTQETYLLAGTLRQDANRLEVAERVIARSEDALSVAEASANAAQDAAGTTGDASLASWFQDYARNELRASLIFRVCAFATLICTGLVAWWFFLESEKTDFTVGGIVFRGAIILAVAGVSTYSIRLAGQHRHQGNWAQTIAVQLKSFKAFLEPVAPGPLKDAIYEQFARRVLGAPPEGKSQANEGALNVTAQDLVALMPKQN